MRKIALASLALFMAAPLTAALAAAPENLPNTAIQPNGDHNDMNYKVYHGHRPPYMHGRRVYMGRSVYAHRIYRHRVFRDHLIHRDVR